jgi:tRNA(fMet)-specific endonuclease VapC
LSYLFDTDILSNTLKKRPSATLISRMAEVPRVEQFTSAITVGEMLYGAYRSSRSAELLARLATDFWPSIQVLAFDFEAAQAYARVRSDLERIGQPLAEADLRIAAIAISRNLTLVSGNDRHFSRVSDLKLENWL